MAGAIGLRAAPGRVLMVIGLKQEKASSFVTDAERLGFIVRADDPRRHVVACAGAPICSSAHIAARAIAPCDRASVRAASWPLVRHSHFRLRQGLRPSGARRADHRRYAERMRAHRRWRDA